MIRTAAFITVLIVLPGLKLSAQSFSSKVDSVYTVVIKTARFKISDDSACKKAIADGFKDMQLKQVKYIYYGYSGGWPIQYLEKAIKEKYTIDVDFPGCMATNYAECYNKTVDPYIYSEFSKTMKQIVEEEQFNYWSGRGSRNPSYMGSEVQLEKDLNCLMKSPLKGYIAAKLIIDTIGNVTDVTDISIDVFCDTCNLSEGPEVNSTDSSDSFIKSLFITSSAKSKSLKKDFIRAAKKLSYYPALKDSIPVIGVDRIHFYYNTKRIKDCK